MRFSLSYRGRFFLWLALIFSFSISNSFHKWSDSCYYECFYGLVGLSFGSSLDELRVFEAWFYYLAFLFFIPFGLLKTVGSSSVFEFRSILIFGMSIFLFSSGFVYSLCESMLCWASFLVASWFSYFDGFFLLNFSNPFKLVKVELFLKEECS
jgi:hypothetical protein